MSDSTELPKEHPQCRRCSAQITFDGHLRSETTGKLVPLNLDLTPHHCNRLVRDEETLVLSCIRYIQWVNGMLGKTSLRLVREAKVQ